MIRITKEDLQYIRQHIADKHGKEMTIDQVLELIRDVKKVEVIDEPGLVTIMRHDGNSSTGGSSEHPSGS